MNAGNSVEMDAVAPIASAREFEEFIYLVSHDVRNSVRALIELPQWIEEDMRNAGQRIDGPIAENLGLLNVHMRRLDRMLIDLLIYSRIGRMQTVGEVEWDDALDSVLSQFRLPPRFRLVRDLRAPTVRMGQNDVVTLISSLLSNAVKHHDRPEGTVHLTTRATASCVTLEIADDGPGIPKPQRMKVFEVMTTLKPRDEIEGSGMGLANVRKIVTHYGGRIEWLDPDADRGCHLALHFPRDDVAVH